MLFKTGVDLHSQLLTFLRGVEQCNIYVPYIKLNALKPLIEARENTRMVIVRWEPRDLITEASDLELFTYLQEKGITLYRNPRLHLKAFVSDYKRALIGSANISQRAFNIPETEKYNYELATIVENLDLSDRLYFSMIETESILITQHIYEQIREQLPHKRKSFPAESDFELQISYPDKDFSIASLPMTFSVETLFRIYETHESIHEIELNCTMHDLALFKLPLGLPLAELKRRLKANFFQHPFIRAFLANLDSNGEIYFGGAKDWIHKNCSDVPTPRKWEITENIQILYRWVTFLSDGIYKVDRPSYSERLYIDKNF